MMADWTRRLQEPCPLPARLNAAALSRPSSSPALPRGDSGARPHWGPCPQRAVPTTPPTHRRHDCARLTRAERSSVSPSVPCSNLLAHTAMPRALPIQRSRGPCPCSDVEGHAHTAIFAGILVQERGACFWEGCCEGISQCNRNKVKGGSTANVPKTRKKNCLSGRMNASDWYVARPLLGRTDAFLGTE